MIRNAMNQKRRAKKRLNSPNQKITRSPKKATNRDQITNYHEK